MKKKKEKKQSNVPVVKDTSPKIFQRDKIKFELKINDLNWTEKQREILETSLKKDTSMIVIDGIWGSGKTLLAIRSCLQLLNEKKISNILYIRNAVQSGSGTLGWLPGDISTRLGPYAAPLYQKLEELLPPSEAKKLISEGIAECQPIALLRGTSYNCYGIIIDEASCMTKEDIMIALSRVGKFCKVFLIGDDYQRDVNNSGFKKLYEIFDDEESRSNGVYTYKLQEEMHVMRSAFLQFVMKKVRANDVKR